jgi:acetate kinase
MRVLAVNAGSSSLKVGIVDGDATASATVDWGAEGRAATLRRAIADAGAGTPDVDAVAHRVVHGGERLTNPVAIDDAVLAEIEAVGELAPLHNAVSLETIAAARTLLSGVPHVACFDTGFHAGLPEAARRDPIPSAWHERWGIRRFGFHGLSVEWSVQRAAELLKRPISDLQLVVAHLGSGCSVTAVAGGRSVWASMGFTPLDGLMMRTRSGAIDPGIVVHVMRHGGLDPDQVADALEHESGLAGVGGGTGDVRDLEAAAAGGSADAALAIEMFAARAAAGIAAAATSLGHLDAVVFTGGIGEHAGSVRSSIVARLVVLGVPRIPSDEPGHDRVIEAGPPAVLRVEAREDIVMARAAEAVLR